MSTYCDVWDLSHGAATTCGIPRKREGRGEVKCKMQNGVWWGVLLMLLLGLSLGLLAFTEMFE